jgi:hypothetical protein
METNMSDGHEQCTAPHPARAFLLSLPAFAIVIGVALVLWKFAT